MLGDRTGKVARIFGLVDIIIHSVYSVMFLVNRKGVVEAVKVTGKGILSFRGVGMVLDHAREAFEVEETENKVEDTT